MDREELKKKIETYIKIGRIQRYSDNQTADKIMEFVDEYKKPIRKQKTIEERKDSFIEKLTPHTEKYTAGLIMDFISYWTEANDGAKKMRFEMKKNQPFNIGRRLGTWKKNQKNFGNDDQPNSNTGQVSAW